MRIVVAADSFKGTLSAAEASRAVAAGVRAARPDAAVAVVPMADGGEGTLDALVAARDGTVRHVEVHGPLQRSLTARYGVLDGGRTAIIEMAEAAGLLRIAPDPPDIMRSTTFGVGQLMGHALDNGVVHLLVAIGGSATNDGGCGMAQALGFRLLDEQGAPLADGVGGGDLSRIDRIVTDHVTLRLRDATVEVLCDVFNPLTGPHGAARVYGGQKGASAEQIEQLDAALGHVAGVMKRDLGAEVAELPGAGAAGGLGAGLAAFCGAALVWGAERVIDLVGLAEQCRGADAIITGEGRLDAQSLNGKVVSAVAGLGRRLGVPVYAVAGQVSLPPERWRNLLIGAAAVQEGDAAPGDSSDALTRRAAAAARCWFC